jgi:serine/threonine protein phosphatase PrpC
VSDVSNTTFSGYLLKRSNQPHTMGVPIIASTRINNTTVDVLESDDVMTETAAYWMHMDVSERSESSDSSSSVCLQPKCRPLEDYLLSDQDSLPQLPKLPLHLDDELETVEEKVSTVTAVTTERVEEPESSMSHLDRSLEFAASFFGIQQFTASSNVASAVIKETSSNITTQSKASQVGTIQSDAIKQSASTSLVKRSSSVPIVPKPTTGSNTTKTNTGKDVFKNPGSVSSSPTHNLLRSSSDCGHVSVHPRDRIAEDGHVWRAKYCVLEGGTLYFYRHQSDADTPEAHEERQQGGSYHENTAYTSNLAQSPMPSRTMLLGTIPRNCIWEKRVSLDCVGAVRTAIAEYGPNSFELLAADEDEDDKLILRTETAEEMGEWIFQFHRSIATFVKNMMDTVGSMPYDIHTSSRNKKGYAIPFSITSPVRNTSQLATFSPRYHKWTSPSTPSLSHGHGRNSHHRRRVDSYSRSKTITATGSPTFPPLAEHALPLRRNVSVPLRRPPSPLLETPPERSAPPSRDPETERPPACHKYVPPHLRNKGSGNPVQCVPRSTTPAIAEHPPVVTPKKYVPPHLRNRSPLMETSSSSTSTTIGFTSPSVPQQQQQQPPMSLSLADRAAMVESVSEGDERSGDGSSYEDEADVYDDYDGTHTKLGGCADMKGSILDPEYIPRKASRMPKVQATPFGFRSDALTSPLTLCQWEIGAVSECGVRESNEDSYLIAGDLIKVLDARTAAAENDPTLWHSFPDHPPGLFALFDGHCGNHASRFAAEHLVRFVHDALKQCNTIASLESHASVERVLHDAILRLDETFCNLCVQDGREWESGTTALIAALVQDHLVIANVGDARGVFSRSVPTDQTTALTDAGWSVLPCDGNDTLSGVARTTLWKEVTNTHSPSREDELARIQRANGWVTMETEIPVGQLQRMVLFDDDVIDILKRCFADRYQPSPKAAAPQRILQIHRVCGELAVSRSIGDRDFKAAFNKASEGIVEEGGWDSSLFLLYPENHNRAFYGDLISNRPEFQALRVGTPGISEEFLLLACDGLWDVMDADDAVRVTRDCLFAKQWTAKKAAARLAELAMHLGSSDNITVLVVRFFDRT